MPDLLGGKWDLQKDGYCVELQTPSPVVELARDGEEKTSMLSRKNVHNVDSNLEAIIMKLVLLQIELIGVED